MPADAVNVRTAAGTSVLNSDLRGKFNENRIIRFKISEIDLKPRTSVYPVIRHKILIPSETGVHCIFKYYCNLSWYNKLSKCT